MHVMVDGSGRLVVVLFTGPGRPPIVLSERRRSVSVHLRWVDEEDTLTTERASLEAITLAPDFEEAEETCYATTTL